MKSRAKSRAVQEVHWGVGIENEFVPVLRQRAPRRLWALGKNEDVRKYDALVAFTDYDALLAATNANAVKALPGEVVLDWNDQFTAIEVVTKEWRNKTLGEYVRAIEVTRNYLLDTVLPDALPASVTGERRLAAAPFGANAAVSLSADGAISEAPTLSYLGSYHINITLPHTSEDDDFMGRHVRAAMVLQWMEPLLLGVLGTPSPYAILNPDKHTLLSFRHMREQLSRALSRNLVENGFPRSRDYDGERSARSRPLHEDAVPDPQQQEQPSLRAKLESGVDGALARYANKRGLLSAKALKAAQSEIKRERDSSLKDAKSKFESLHRRLPPWVLAMLRSKDESTRSLYATFLDQIYMDESNFNVYMGSDFRRDESKGAEFGFEFRVLDMFRLENLVDVLRVLWYAMDASRDLLPGVQVPVAERFKAYANTPLPKALAEASAYHSDACHAQYLACVRDGCRAAVSDAYRADLTRVLGVPLPRKACRTVYDALSHLSTALYDKYGQGKGPYSRYVDRDSTGGEYYRGPPRVDNVNQLAWDYFFEGMHADVADYARSLEPGAKLDPNKIVAMTGMSSSGIRAALPAIDAWRGRRM